MLDLVYIPVWTFNFISSLASPGRAGPRPRAWPGRVVRLLTAINSHSSRQLLGNKMSFTICSIYILFISNEYHQFWMSFDFRSRYTKNGQLWAKTQAGRPGTPEGKVPASIQWQYDTIIMPWVEDWISVWSDGSKGLHKEQRTHNSVPTWVQDSDPPTWQDHKCADGMLAQ
jgi:hypothetical protein